MKHKKTKMVSSTKNSNKISQNNKKKYSKHNYLKDVSNIFDTKDDTEKSKIKCQELVEKTIETFNNEQNKPKETSILKVHNQSISDENQFEAKKNDMKTCTNAIQKKLTKTSKKTNIEMNKVGSNQKFEKKSYKLPNNEGRLTEDSAFVNVKELKKTEIVFLDENLNEIVLTKKKSNLKGPNGRPKCILRAVYQENINNDSSVLNCQHKRKLLRLEEIINNFRKRFKKNIL